ncbi:helix-turn-helix transcriptional regulator [Sinorhizobium meliloti]|uniref:S24 family peptidase n=1 Tax=Rhizobium meliloti TaxID=382 RepID=UPI000FDA6A92|nr:S24 family peptidase [Sinorhizobium meliloti]RVI59927.1 helix-turn-helix transcriptional regulator [Sinorhizobium meliloti]
MAKLEQRLREQLAVVFDGNESELARQVGTDQQNINNFITGKVKRSHLWREIGAALRIPEEEMRDLMNERARKGGKNTKLPTPIRVSDFFQEVAPPNARFIDMPQVPDQTNTIPVLGRAVGGDDGVYLFNGEELDRAFCPPILANVPGAYALFVDGESMVPRYEPSDIVFVHPTKPPRRGDHVVVQIKPANEGEPPRGFIKRYVGRTSTKLILEQYNPHKKIEFPVEEVDKVHVIVMAGMY